MSSKNSKGILTAVFVSAAAGATIFAGAPAASAADAPAHGWTKYRVSMPGTASEGQTRRALGSIRVVGKTIDRTCLHGGSYTKITPLKPRQKPIRIGYACRSTKRFQVMVLSKSIAIRVCSARKDRCSKPAYFTIR